MSDPTPEDLYDALRKRLADYGQEPPPGLWAGIRQQLPPVAVPRRRRWRAASLLSLLFVVAALGTWQWQRVGHSAAQTGAVAQKAATPGKAGNGTEGRVAQASATAGQDPKARTPAGSGAVALQPFNGGPATASPQASSDNSLDTNAFLLNKPVSKTEGRREAAFDQNAKSVTPAAALATTGRAARRQRALVVAGVASRAPITRQGRLPRSAPEADLGQEMATTMRPGSKSAVDMAPAGQPAAAGTPQTTPAAVTLAAGEPEAAARATIAASHSENAGRAGQADQTRRAGATSDATNPAALPSPASGAQAEWDWLSARLVGLQIPEAAAPAAPRPVAVAALARPVPAVVSRWAVQLVAGPGVTYRHLGTSSLFYPAATLATPSPGTSINSSGSVVRSFTTASASAAELERPALGYGAQLSIRRSLTPHWTLSGGLGYAEYATGLALRQVNASQITRASYDFAFIDSLSRTNGTTIRQRDTYRFLTVPLRAGYAWTTGRRWQVGLLGGFEAAIYLGGTSTEGSACACQPQTWSSTGSPYRSLSLAASLGAEVRYRLAGPWQLLAQPTASYLLTPLAKPVSGYSIRHLFGATALLGVSYDLP
jgi:hypothetical protein